MAALTLRRRARVLPPRPCLCSSSAAAACPGRTRPSAFPARQDPFPDRLTQLPTRSRSGGTASSTASWPLLERAARTGDTSRVGEANELSYNAAARIDDGDRHTSHISLFSED